MCARTRALMLSASSIQSYIVIFEYIFGDIYANIQIHIQKTIYLSIEMYMYISDAYLEIFRKIDR